MKYRCVRYIFPVALTENQEELLISRFQYVREAARANMEASQQNLLSKLSEKLPSEQFSSVATAIRANISALIRRIDEEKMQKTEKGALFILQKESAGVYLFGFDSEAFAFLSIKQQLPFGISVDYSEKIQKKLMGGFKDELAQALGFRKEEVIAHTFEYESD